MITLNMVTRVSDDKCFFVDLLYAAHQVKTENNIDVKLNFIGAIENFGIYYTIMRLAGILKLEENVFFSKRSIWVSDLPQELQVGYFINFSIGNFFGYSGIDCMQNRLKTVFLNIDPAYTQLVRKDFLCYCADISGIVSLIRRIHQDPGAVEEKLKKENEELLAGYALNSENNEFLKSVLLDIPGIKN
jgi:hypothetical protein